MADITATLRETSPEDPTHEGCPVRTKRQTIIVDKGVPTSVEWTMRNRNGEDFDLSGVLPPSEDSLSESVSGYATVKARFTLCDIGTWPIYEAHAHSLDPAAMQGHLAVYNAAMSSTKTLRKVERELIALVVSDINGCHY